MNVATAVLQLDTEFFDQRCLSKIYNLSPTQQQTGSMNVLKRIQPPNDVILISEDGEEIPSVPTGSVSVPPSNFSQIEFPFTEEVNQSQIDSPSISAMLHLGETDISLKIRLQEYYRFITEKSGNLSIR